MKQKVLAAVRLMSTSTKHAKRPLSHKKARWSGDEKETAQYPRNPEINRFPVPDDKVTWDVAYDSYEPVDYTAPSVSSKPVWADPDYKPVQTAQSVQNALPSEPVAIWNSLDGKIDRRSHMGQYLIKNGIPVNPVGRTGVCSRGLLGRWGPNHAADPIVTRWKRDHNNKIVIDPSTKKKKLQFVAIQRKDTKEWAIPGGMVNAGENVSVTLKREFSEEAMNYIEATKTQQATMRDKVRSLFAGGTEVYRGYVDDPRNTDNAWMETVAVNFHDATGESVGKFKLHAGDDAVGVMWQDLHSGIQLYASHVEFCKLVVNRLGAHW